MYVRRDPGRESEAWDSILAVLSQPKAPYLLRSLLDYIQYIEDRAQL